MKPSSGTFFCVAMLAAAAMAADPPAPQPASAPSGQGSLLEGAEFNGSRVPLTPAAQLRPRPPDKAASVLPEGEPVADRLTTVAKDPTGRWWTISDDRVGQLYLLPCALLEAVENERASPETRFRLTGVIYQYRGGYYLMLREAALVLAPTAPATKPADDQPAQRKAPTTLPTATAPADSGPATAEDVSKALMQQTPRKPILPVAPDDQSEAADPSVPPTGKPLPAGPGQMVVNRLTRLFTAHPGGWAVLTFEADNTLREPPMRILPNPLLERMERLLPDSPARGARFHVSGRVHHYRGRKYVLLRYVRRKREMGQF